MRKGIKTGRRGAVPKTKPRVIGQEVFTGISQKQLDASLARVRKMTQGELVESLKKCGVLTPTGKLAKRYRS